MNRQVSGVLDCDFVLVCLFGIWGWGTFYKSPIFVFEDGLSVGAFLGKPELVVLLEVFCEGVERFDGILLNLFMKGLYYYKAKYNKVFRKGKRSTWESYLSLRELVNFLNSGSDCFLSVLKTEGRLPFGAGPDFHSSVVFVFLLEFQDQFNRISLHIFLTELDLRYFWYFFIGVSVWRVNGRGVSFWAKVRGGLFVLLKFIIFGVYNNSGSFVATVILDLLPLPEHGVCYFYYYEFRTTKLKYKKRTYYTNRQLCSIFILSTKFSSAGEKLFSSISHLRLMMQTVPLGL